MKLQVWTGAVIIGGVQKRCVVTAASQRRAVALLKLRGVRESEHRFRHCWGVSRSREALHFLSRQREGVWVSPDMSHWGIIDYKELTP